MEDPEENQNNTDTQDFDITKLEPYIDWSPFFRSWTLHISQIF
jgi:cobalamin-dependent methionine synthase I